MSDNTLIKVNGIKKYYLGGAVKEIGRASCRERV